MDVTIKHDGRNWVIENDCLKLSSPSLEQLDARLAELMRTRKMVANGEKTMVFMGFDNSTIPEWMRPYAQHYFNRMVEIRG